MILRSIRNGVLRVLLVAVLAVIFTVSMIPAVVPAYAGTDINVPTLTAVVKEGVLSVEAFDDASGIAAIFVNGFEFPVVSGNSISIRMQQFDTGYQYFTIQAKDGAGNLSEVYRVNNPFYSFPDEDNGQEGSEPSLPPDAEPSEPTDSEADVTDHMKTDDEGNRTFRRKYGERSSSSSVVSNSSNVVSRSSSVRSSGSYGSVKKRKAVEDFVDEEVEDSRVRTEDGREFYTITTKTGKVFYLVIDRDRDAETVHFLTDISERDLLNVTSDNKPVLPQNSAVVVKEAGLQEVSAGAGRDGSAGDEEEHSAVIKDSVSWDSVSAGDLLVDEPVGETEVSDEEVSPSMSVLRKYGSLFAVGFVGLIVVIGYFVSKFLKSGDDEDYEEDEEADDDEDLLERDSERDRDDFFMRMEDFESGEEGNNADQRDKRGKTSYQQDMSGNSDPGNEKNVNMKADMAGEDANAGQMISAQGEKKAADSGCSRNGIATKAFSQERSAISGSGVFGDGRVNAAGAGVTANNRVGEATQGIQHGGADGYSKVVYSPVSDSGIPDERVYSPVSDVESSEEVYSPLPRSGSAVVEDEDFEEVEDI